MVNQVLLLSVCSWALAQILKLFISAAINRKFELTYLLTGGGMPSSHSSLVCTLRHLHGHFVRRTVQPVRHQRGAGPYRHVRRGQRPQGDGQSGKSPQLYDGKLGEQ